MTTREVSSEDRDDEGIEAEEGREGGMRSGDDEEQTVTLGHLEGKGEDGEEREEDAEGVEVGGGGRHATGGDRNGDRNVDDNEDEEEDGEEKGLPGALLAIVMGQLVPKVGPPGLPNADVEEEVEVEAAGGVIKGGHRDGGSS